MMKKKLFSIVLLTFLMGLVIAPVTSFAESSGDFNCSNTNSLIEPNAVVEYFSVEVSCCFGWFWDFRTSWSNGEMISCYRVNDAYLGPPHYPLWNPDRPWEVPCTPY